MKIMTKLSTYKMTKKIAKLQRLKNYYTYRNLDDKVQLIDKKLSLLSKKLGKIQSKDNEHKHLQLDKYKKLLEQNPDHDQADMMQTEILNNADYEAFIADENAHLMVSHLTMRFGGLKAVDDLSITVNKGEIFGLIGPNGAGKTTVFNCMTQFYRPNLGKVFFKDNQNTPRILNNYQTHDIINLGMSRTFQNVELIWELSVMDNLLVGAHALYSSGFFTQLLHLPKLKLEEIMFQQKAENILDMLGIKDYQYALPFGLPYGILKKVELARTLMSDPKLIILDEPAAGLNETETIELAKTIQYIQKTFDVTIILVEHDMGLVMNVCDRICAISFGKMIAMGTPEYIQNHPQVQEAYLGVK